MMILTLLYSYQDESRRTLEHQLMKIHRKVERMSKQRERERRASEKKLLAYKTIVNKLSTGILRDVNQLD